MIRNYLKIAFRNLRRNKEYAIINIFGIAVGIAASLLIFLVIQFQTSFDDFHPKKKDIYRIGSIGNSQDGIHYSDGVAFPVANGLRLDYPQLKEVASIFKSSESQIKLVDSSNAPKKFQSDVYYAEPEFFGMFNFEWISGDAKTVLSDPSSAALTKSTAEKFFGDWHAAIGKTIMRNNDNKEVYRIRGILKDPPVNTDFPLSVVLPYSNLKNTQVAGNLNDWVSTYGNAYSFAVFSENMQLAAFNKELLSFAKKHKPAEYAKDAYIAQPMADIHFNDDFGNYRDHTFSHSLINALAVIGIFLLVIACVNFINLATAQAVTRSKEVGVRKVLGSSRSQLVFQFISETALIVIASLIIATIIAALVLPSLNKLLEVQMSMNFLSNPVMIIFLFALALFVTLLSGFYPAVILSGFKPVIALKSKITSNIIGGISLKRALVVLQFSIAQVLIIGMLVVASQMNYFQKASLGYDKAAIINVPLPDDSISHSKFAFIRNQLMQRPEIKNVSFSFAAPTSAANWNSDFKFDHSEKSTNFSANLKWADTGYFNTYGLHFVAGRPYHSSDTVTEFVVNETLLKKLGINNPKEAIGKQINLWDGSKVALIVGVVNDFNASSLKEPLAPVLLSSWNDVYGTVSVKIIPGKEKAALEFVEKLWNSTFPDYLYKYSFLDDSINKFYKQERQLSTLYQIFAAIAIFISCLGLYGLVSFMVTRRAKEVGVRKVLGASPKRIVYLLSGEFTLLIFISFVIAAPIAWYLMHQWLESYTYRIHIGVAVFLATIIGSTLVAWLTVGHKAIRASLANPVKSLRSE